ncbi:TPA: hypothetical protein N0F65_004585 [Lagenidium giganteum]|uniref:Enoyl reductase (ER) domain-containing protein n=1 Tax=Lagenidium giganteum TaxID=4803 RepID=A0AAV2ZCZ7_9STRA|nr:TPA: hypothetical protein N0F65_004585 [Lagenidium giganteum]
MRAWYHTKFGGPAVAQLGELPEPELRDAQDVIIKVHAVALNPMDYKRRQGAMKFILGEKWPHVLGYDVSGVVVSCGAQAKKFRPGEQVYCMLPHDGAGALAEVVAVHESYVAHKPENLTHVQAAAIPMVFLTAILAFRAGHLTEDKRVFVTGGAGGVGSAAIQVAKRMFKASNIATTAASKKADKLKSLGADVVIDHHMTNFESELHEFDFSLDCTGEAKKCIECVTKQGTVVSITETPSPDVLHEQAGRGVRISRFVGMVLDCLSYSVAKKARRNDVNYKYFFVAGQGEVLEEIRPLFESKQLVPVIDRTFQFEKADAAMEYLEAGHATGKVVVEVVK